MKYLSLFSGIGGFELAIQSVFPNAECIGFSEIDKYAIQTYLKHYPEHKNLGSVTDINPLQELVPEGIKSLKENIDMSIDELQKHILEEKSSEERLSIILIWINKIMMSLICLSAPEASIRYSIGNLRVSQESSISWDILSLRMENICLISNTQRYRQLGNAVCVEVVKHIMNELDQTDIFRPSD